MGITQHRTGTDNVKSLANLAMLCGKVGYESCGINPLRGQNNVQGACDMGCLPNVFRLPERRTGCAEGKIRDCLGRETPRQAGPDRCRDVESRRRGQAQGPLLHGREHAALRPGPAPSRKSTQKLDLFVVQDIFPRRLRVRPRGPSAACFAEKAAPSPTRSAVSSVSARPSSRPEMPAPTGRSSPTCQTAWDTP